MTVRPADGVLAIAGPGRMGAGIATAVLMAGHSHTVRLIDTKERLPGNEWNTLEQARDQVYANLEHLQRLGMIERDPEEIAELLELHRLLPEALRGCTFVFEALPELQEAKAAFYEAASHAAEPDTVIASATSTFSLELFRGMYAHPEQIVTAHWLNPAFLIPLVEIGHAGWTDADAVDRTRTLLEALGKVPVTLASSPGFIVPRIQVAAMNEAVRILEEGVATAEEIDTAVKAGFGFRLSVLGLIEFIDLGGLDILARAGSYLDSELEGAHYAPPPSVQEKYGKGELGPKTGRGYYDYSGVDVGELFQNRYVGFADLLACFARSKGLSFRGGIVRHDVSGASDGPQAAAEDYSGNQQDPRSS